MNSSSSSSLRRNWMHHVFPSFHGEDVRKFFLSHVIKEFKRKGIDLFVDNDIERSKTIGRALKIAIQGSRIAIVLLSKNYASSSWCLDELVEIIKCMEDLDQVVMTVFYEVNPSDVKKQKGNFGEVFQKTCVGKTKEVIEKWSEALTQVATIAGYHTINWKTDAELIEDLATDVSKILFSSSPSRDLDCLVGMEVHMEKIERVLRTDLDEARMIGIWGPAGIGKSTIARFLFNRHSRDFQLSVFMEDIRATYPIPVSSDDYYVKLHLQQKFMSQIMDQKDVKIPHLRAVEDRLKNKKVLVVLDGVDRLVHLEAMAEETRWFGYGSRIIVTTQDLNLLKAHGINHNYKVPRPQSNEALQIFCKYAFNQNSPKDGFEELARGVTLLAGKLPLGLRVMGSYFREMPKQVWLKELPNLRNSLKGEIETILKFNYDALCDKDQSLFLHLACFFNFEIVHTVEDFLVKTFPDIKERLKVLVRKSLISISTGFIEIESLLIQLGKEIVRKKYLSDGKHSIRKPWKRQFLDGVKDIAEVLINDTMDCSSIIGIDLTLYKMKGKFYISERAFERMSNLQFLRVVGAYDKLHFPPSLNPISPQLRLLDWAYFAMTCLPPNFNPASLVDLCMPDSKLEKLWDGIRPLGNLQRMDLTNSENLKKLPDFSTATKLKTLLLNNCSSLVKIPSSIRNATNISTLYISGCSSLVKLPFSIGNLTYLTSLCFDGCSSLVGVPSSIGNLTRLTELSFENCSSLVELPSSIGNLYNLSKLILQGCSKLEVLPININMKSLKELDISNCLLLKTFPEISPNVELLKLNGTLIKEVPLAIKAWSHLEEFHMSYFENLKDLPHALDKITTLHFTDNEVKEVPPWIEKISHLRLLVLRGCRKIISLPQLPDSLSQLEAENCESLERLDCSFHNPDIFLNFRNCFKLNQEARDLIIKTSDRQAAIIPGGEVPVYFSDRATGGTLAVKLNGRKPHKSLRFKACIVLLNEGESGARGVRGTYVSYKLMKNLSGPIIECKPGVHILPLALVGHFYTFELEAHEVTSKELCFDFKVNDNRTIKECGVLQLS